MLIFRCKAVIFGNIQIKKPLDMSGFVQGMRIRRKYFVSNYFVLKRQIF